MKAIPKPLILLLAVLISALVGFCWSAYALATELKTTNANFYSNAAALTLITDQPVAAFTAAIDNSLSCISKTVDFTDQSTPKGSITKWEWDFGDGQTSALSNPTHTYNGYGNYTVILTVTSLSGDKSTTKQMVNVSPKLLAKFGMQTQSCPGQEVTLTDNSSIQNGTIVQWKWGFGDGSSEVSYPDNRPVKHIYTKAGPYTASLQVISSTSCVSDAATRSIMVSPVDTPGFKQSDVCQSDQYAQFIDTTHFANGNPGYTYLWNFGDSLATNANPNSSNLQNPKHHYSQQGIYNVSLTLTSPSGCALTTTRQFTVNGDNPTAGFTISKPLCASDSITLTNTSSVSFGNITKVEIFWDADGAPNTSNVYYRSANQIPANNQFKHLYSLPTGMTSKSFHIVLFASSGETSTCRVPYSENIEVFANPSISLTPLNSVCIESGTKQIAENKNGYTGTGIFSGPGVSSTGLFDPQAAGLGKHTIHYIFTASSGCTYVDSTSVSVYKSPTINLVSNALALEGSAISLNPKVSGDSLTFKWSPSMGVSNPDILNPLFSPTVNTTYTLTVNTKGGCSGVAQVAISVLKTPVIPSAFTPNGDGINDTWEIKYIDSYPDATVDIYNRYGAKVYTSVGYALPWDGKMGSKQLPLGVYYYVINPKRGRSLMTGSVTIIK